jgi:hypothetical protein
VPTNAPIALNIRIDTVDPFGASKMSSTPLSSKILVYCCGFLFSMGWWVVIAGIYLTQISLLVALPPLFVTFSLLLLTRVPSSAMGPSDSWDEQAGSKKLVLFGLILAVIVEAIVSWIVWMFYHKEILEFAGKMPPIGTTMLAVR